MTVPESDLVAYRLEELSKKMDTLDERLTRRFAADDATRIEMALRVDRLEQQLRLYSKALGAGGVSVAALIADAVRGML